MKFRTTVSAVIFNQEGEVLICKQKDGNGVFPGQWALPGGGIEDKERMVEALKREIKEEAGISITDIKPFHFSDGVRAKYRGGKKMDDVYMIYLRFTAETKNTKVVLNDEHDEYVWVSKDKIEKYDLNEPTIDSFKRLGWIKNKKEIHKEWVKYPTGKISHGSFCQSCKRFNVRNSTVQLIAVSDGKVLLQKRNINPEKGSWALVGGYVGWDESLEEGMARELKEEVGLKVDSLKLVGIYSDPKRDADGRQNLAIVYAGEVRGKLKIDVVEVEDARWFDFDKLPDKIAFDHREMIGDYLNKN